MKNKELGRSKYLIKKLHAWAYEALVSSRYKYWKADAKAFVEIKSLIQQSGEKPGVDEKFIEEKAIHLKEIIADLFRRKGTMNYPLGRCEDFIRQLVAEVRKAKEQ